MVLSLFMIDAASEPVWDLFGGASSIWFPFRLLAVVAFATSLFSGFAIEVLRGLRWQVGALIVMGALALLVLPGLSPMASGVTEDFVGPNGISAFETLNGTVALTAGGEFLPAWATGQVRRSSLVASSAAGLPPNPVNSSTGARVQGAELVVDEPQHREVRLSADAEARVTFNLFFYPSWRATIDGRLLPIEPDPVTGLIVAAIPPGDHTIVFDFVMSLPVLVSSVVSLMALSVVSAVAAFTIYSWHASFGGGRRLRYLALASGLSLLALAGGWALFAGAFLLPDRDAIIRYEGDAFVSIDGPAPLERIRGQDVVVVEIEADVAGLDPPVTQIIVDLANEGRVTARRIISVPADGRLDRQEVKIRIAEAAPLGPYADTARLVPAHPRRPVSADARPLVNALEGAELRTMPFLIAESPRPEPAERTRLNSDWTLVNIELDDLADGTNDANPTIRAGEILRLAAVLEPLGDIDTPPGYSIRLFDRDGVLRVNRTREPVELARLGK